MESRPRAIPIAPGYWRNPFIGAGEDEHKQGSRSEHKADAPPLAKSAFDFLNTRFEEFPIVKFSDLYSQENYDFLYRSARNYLKLLGKDIGLEPDGHDFVKLFNQFNTLLPHSQECELYRYANDIYFHVIDNPFDWEIYYIPCAIIHKVGAELSGILLDFFSLFQHTQGLTTLKEDPVYQIFINDTNHSCLDDKDEHRKLASDYENGYIGKVLDKIAREPKTSITKLSNRIKKYNPRSEDEAGVLALMAEGLELFRKKQKIIQSGFFPNETEDYYNCYSPVEVHRTLMIVYEEDPLHEMVYNWVVDEAHEQSAETFSGGNKIITPQTRSLLKVDPYVIDFLNWLKRFEDELHDL